MRGSVVNKKGNWYIVYYTGKDEQGKWKQKWESGFATKKEAEKALRRRVDEIENSFANRQASSTLAVYLHHWLDTYCAQRLAANTIRGYRNNIDKHIIPSLGKIRLDRLQPQDIQQLYGQLLGRGLSSTSVRYVHNTLHRALVSAVKAQLVGRNAADLVDAPTVRAFEAKTLSPEQAARLIAACRDCELQLPVLFALLLGLRRGETLGLQWADVDLRDGLLQVRHSANFDQPSFCLSDVKTKNSRRTLMLPADLLTLLRQKWQHNQAMRQDLGQGFNPHDLVICRADGSPLSSNALNHLFRDMLAALGLPAIRFHDLRHTNATLMLRNQIPAKIVSAMLGHATVGVTLDIYSHVMTDMQQGAVDVMENLLRQANTPDKE